MVTFPSLRAIVAVAAAPVAAVAGFATGALPTPRIALLVGLLTTPLVALLVWAVLGGLWDRRGPPGGVVGGPARWSAVSRSFHWLMAACILGTAALMYWMQGIDVAAGGQPARLVYRGWLGIHKSVGLIVLFLVLFRWAWNRRVPRPPLHGADARPQRAAVHAVHHSIYLLMLVVPLLGWFASMTYGGKTHFFGLFDMPMLFGKDEQLVKVFYPGHVYLSWALLGIVGLHTAAALWHHLRVKDATLWQMLPGRDR